MAKVTEADRQAWMRQFVTALEQWKTCLDSLQDGAPEICGTTSADPNGGALPPQNPFAALQAHQAQMMQHLQIMQQAQQVQLMRPQDFVDVSHK
mmetsp:Transcript_104443/g.162873  ORF Transcript_104443/g.162873 Transcript_104443/m.162873 type:complete len:94 (+) Transcript_104443:105-386(+)